MIASNQCTATSDQNQDGGADQAIGRLRHGLAIRYCVLLAMLALVLLPAADRARADPLPISSGGMGPSLRGGVALLTDPSRELRLANVLARDKDFVRLSSGDLSLGSTTDAAWLKIRIEVGRRQPALLTITPTFVDFVDVYVAYAAADLSEVTPEHFSHVKLGDHRPRPRDDVSALDDVIPLDLGPDHATLVYVRAASVNSSLNLSLSLYPATEHTLRTTLTGLSYGMWFGGMTVLVLIQLVFLYFDRKPFYVLLAASSLGAMMVYAANLGLSRLLFFPDGGHGNDLFHSGSVWLGLTASALMTASVLELHRRSRWLLLAFRTGALVGLVGVGFVIAGKNLVFAPYGSLFIALLSTLAMVQSLRTRNDTGPGTGLTAAAFTVLWLGLVATLAQRNGVFDLPNWVSQTYGISSLLYTILLTAGLGARLRAAETQNRLMSDQALEHARAAERRANALVAERTRDLAAAKKRAEDALQAELESQQQQIRFMEVISHQYRTPLASIRTNIDSIGLSLPPDDQANCDRVNRVRRGVARLVEVLEVNLARSLLQGPSIKASIIDTRLGDLLLSAVERGRDLFPNADICCEMALEVDSIQIPADAGMIETAIINLLENAVKFSKGTLTPTIRLHCMIKSHLAVIAVRDEGIGIPAHDLAKIARRFARGSNATGIEGSGLGLSLVERVASTHGGDITIDSIEHIGTTICIRLPLWGASARSDDAAQQSSHQTT